MARPAKLRQDVRRCEPYSDGPWFVAYDVSHAPHLKAERAYDALLGLSSGAEADRVTERIAGAGLAIACELGADIVSVDVLIGARLGAAQKKKAEWVDPQRGFLSIPSGRLRIDSLNTLSFGPDQADAEGCELGVPAGDYDVVVHRVAWERMGVESRDERPDLPAAVLELSPVGRKGPKMRAARLTLAGVLGETGMWLASGRVEQGVFHGTVRAHDLEAHGVLLNLLGAHAEAMGLRFGETLEIATAGERVKAPFVAYMTRRGMSVYFGQEWFEEHLGDDSLLAGFAPFQGSPPWLVEVEGARIQPGAAVTATRGAPWCAVAERGAVSVEKGRLTGRLLSTSRATLIVNFGPAELKRAGLGDVGALQLVAGGEAYPLHLYSHGSQVAELRKRVLAQTASDASRRRHLLANTMPFWDDPGLRLFWLMPLLGEATVAGPRTQLSGFLPQEGDQHQVRAAAGAEVVLQAAS